MPDERQRGVFMISVAAELAEMHPQTLRMYEARGLIEPKRSPKGTRLYSQADVDKLRRIQEMTNELGLNLAGVERVLELEEQLERAARRLEALERRSAEMRRQMEDEIERIRASVRAELVPYRRIATDLVHVQRAKQAAAGGRGSDGRQEPAGGRGEAARREAGGRRNPAGRRIPVERDES
jgi:MerR family transcriptional regulator, heat shock protein HspR